MKIKEKHFNIICELGTVQKNAINPFAKAKYVTLSNVQKHLMPLFEKHKVIPTFVFEKLVDGVYESRFTLLDVESEETLTYNFAIPLDNTQKNNVQAFGATTTYAQRYIYCVVFQIALDDEDPDAQKQPPAKPAAIDVTAEITALRSAKNLTELQKLYLSYSKDVQFATCSVKDEMKGKLS